MSMVYSSFEFFPPLIAGVSGGGTRIVQLLSSVASSSSTALEVGTRGIIVNSAAAVVNVRFTAGASTAVTTDLQLQRSGYLMFDTDENTKIVSVVSNDAATTYQCWVWTCGPKGA